MTQSIHQKDRKRGVKKRNGTPNEGGKNLTGGYENRRGARRAKGATESSCAGNFLHGGRGGKKGDERQRSESYEKEPLR